VYRHHLQTQEGSGFTGLLRPERYSVAFGGTTLQLNLGGSSNGTLRVASSDTIVVDGDSGAAELVLTYPSWNVLVGYAPHALLAPSAEEDQPQALPSRATAAAAACNLTGGWAKGPPTSAASRPPAEYTFVEAADGSFTVTASGASSWHTASGSVATDGSVRISFGTKPKPFEDHAPALTQPCNEIKWTEHPQPWHRVGGAPVPPPPTPPGCTLSGSMAICHGISNTVFSFFTKETAKFAATNSGQLTEIVLGDRQCWHLCCRVR